MAPHFRTSLSMSYYDPTCPWRQTRRLARERRAESLKAVDAPRLPEELPPNVMEIPYTVLSDRDLELTSQNLETLHGAIAAGRMSSVEVVDAYLRRAAVAQGLTNCITDLLPTRALAQAAQLDDQMRRRQTPIGPLHGVPVSVKEHICMEGLDSNMGYCSLYGRIAMQDALILKILRAAGAVFHARTTEPQTLMHLETDSNLYGVTVNPYHKELTPGGSSGGEAALIALGGSPLGIGTDIGGSIRVPAANCGIYGFKPSTGRLPMLGVDDGSEGLDQILTAIGPLAESFSSIQLFMKTVMDAKPWMLEAGCLNLPWRIDDPTMLPRHPAKLRVALMLDDGIVVPHPPIRRAIQELVEFMQRDRDRVMVVPWVPYKHDEAWEIIASLHFIDGGASEHAAMAASGEPRLPLTKAIIDENQHVPEDGFSPRQLQEAVAARDRYRQEHTEHWNKTATQFDKYGTPMNAIDVLICPVGPCTAPQHNSSTYWNYTSQWNLLDYPALAFPISTVDSEEDVKDTEYVPRNPEDEANHEIYDPDLYDGVPVSLQLVARRHEDEKLLQAYEFLEPYIQEVRNS